MYDHVITLFCRHGDLWYPSIIDGVDLVAAESGSPSALAGNINADSVEMIIHCTVDKTVTTRAGAKRYLFPKEYAVIGSPADYLTFTPNQDFFADFEWLSTDPIADDAYGDTGLYSAFNEDHDRVYMITSVKHFALLPHFEIGGR